MVYKKQPDLVFGYSQVGNETDKFHAVFLCFVAYWLPSCFV